MTDKTDVMRGEFERRFTFVLNLKRNARGHYVSSSTFEAWDGFKAGYQAALQSPAVRELVDALRLAREEIDGLPHSLGYEFTHIPKMDKALANFASIAKWDKP